MKKKLPFLLFLLALITFGFDVHSQTIRYVRVGGSGNHSGSSWANASPHLQDMINASSAGQQVWVAAGIHTPPGATGYSMKEGVAIYGGFAATGNPAFADRNWQVHISTLRGYAPGQLNLLQRVITNDNNGLTTATVLDGFTITGGRLFQSFTTHNGAGMYNVNVAPLIRNCLFTDNQIDEGRGAGVYNAGSGPSGSSALFNNCTFSNNSAFYHDGGGMANYFSHPTLVNCTFSGNRAGTAAVDRGGSGLYNENSSPIATNCTFSNNNDGAQGGGVRNINNSNPTFYRCSFLNNSAVSAGGAMYNYACPNITFFDCVFADNAGGAFYNENSGQTFTNCVFYGNSSNSVGSVIFNRSASSYLYSCVLTGNTGSVGAIYNTNNLSGVGVGIYNSVISGNSHGVYLTQGSRAEIFNSLVQSFTPHDAPSGTIVTTANNIDGAIAPLFVNAANPRGADGIWRTADDGLRLQPCSPLIGVGNNALVVPSTDIINNTRIQHGTVDIGAYESNYVPASGSNLFVNADMAVSGTGTAWSSAFKTLREAIQAANQCNSIASIFVAKGTYYPTGAQNGADRDATFLIPQRGGIKIYGGYDAATGVRNIAANPTILSGEIGNPDTKNDNSYHVMVMTGTLAGADSVVIDGFTITGGNANSGAEYTYNGMAGNQNEGGGLLLRGNGHIGEKIVVRNCTITGNAAATAGGLYMWASSALIHNTVIAENSASGNGGGLFIYETPSPKIINSVIRNNTAANGGGIYSTNGSTVTSLSIINTTISDNTASAIGDNIRNTTATINMANTIVWGSNAAKNIDNAATFNATYSNILRSGGVYPGTGNINTAPLFTNPAAGNYLPLSCSPVVNAGNNNAINNAPSGSGTTDISGNPRIVESQVDMGAYELQTASGTSSFTMAAPPPQSTCPGSVFPELPLPPSIANWENGQVCVIINENATQTITAPEGAVFSSVIFASYGNPEGSCGTGFTVGACHAANSLSVAEGLALGNNSFTITANNAAFGGDPCSGTAKRLYLTIAYAYLVTPISWSWENDNPAIGLPASGTGNIPAFEALAPGVANITLRASIDACAISEPVIFTYTVEDDVPVYVDGNISASGNGKSWGTAFKTLGEALEAANQCSSVKNVFVAKGTYYPTGVQGGTDQDATFLIPQRGGIKLYGSYDAATGVRDIAANPTILSGEIGNPDNKNDNSYHVMVMTGTLAGADSVVIDGFTITGGNASGGGTHIYNGKGTSRHEGGGLLLKENGNIGSKITVRNCAITGNSAIHAAGLYMWASSALIHNTVIAENNASGNGGGIFIYETPSPKIVNTVISKNTAANGGGIYNFQAATSLSIINTTISDNTAVTNGNNIHNHAGATINLVNTIVWGSNAAKNIHNEATFNATYSDILQPSGEYPGTGNINETPLFKNPAAGDYLPVSCSPVVNAGNNAAINNAPSGSGTSDIAGNPRIFEDVVDMGAYELQTAAGVAPPFTIITPPSYSACLGSDFPELSLNGENGQVCFTVDGGATQTITAPEGTVFSGVVFASFGTPTGDCSTGFAIGSCHAANSQSFVEGLALGNNSFTITASSAAFGGDPCVGTVKRLYMTLSYSYPTTYTWTNNNTGIGLAASGTGNIPAFTATNTGTATITVIPTNNGCPASPVIFNYTVTTPSATTAQTNVSCYGNNNGSATITNVSDGAAPYTYSWTNSDSDSAKAINLAAGVYTCTITDANGCSVVKTFTITQPDQLTANTSQANVNCYGGNNGSAAITDVSGGAGSYTYLWSTGAITSSIENLTADTYTCTITDANGCFVVKTFTITQPAQLNASTDQTDIGCFGENSGEASVNVSGGTFPYTYLWNTGAITSSIENIPAGDYSCTIEDANGCTIDRNITITQLTLLTATIGKTDLNPCYDEANATAFVVASGGTFPYTYLWNTGAATASITNLPAGNYNCTITDSKGCEIIRNITITNPPNPFLTATITVDKHVSCRGGTDGEATISVAGGTGAYTYEWSNGATSATVSNLIAGTYTCIITDEGGCEITRMITITQPAAVLAATTAKTNAGCYGGSASVAAGGGTLPYTYLWSNGATASSVENLATGDYTCTITDANGCFITKEFTIDHVQLIVPVAPQSVCFGNNTPAVNFASPDITGSSTMCFILNEGQAQTITAPAGQVFTAVLFASYGNASGNCEAGFTMGYCHAANSRSIIENLALGNNSFSVTAGNAAFGGDPCFGTAKKLYLTLTYSNPGSSSSAYSYSWTNDNPSIGLPASGTGGLIPSFTPLAAGVANITLTASLNGCDISETATFTYTVVNKESLYVDGNVSASGNGKSWETAFKTLQEALAAVTSSQCGADSIKVAKGTYMPAGGQFFSMVEGVKILGGYPTGGGERDAAHNQTILKANGNNYIIVNENNGLSNAALLDGFTLAGADDSYYPAIYNYYVSPTINSCVFTNNFSGAIYNYHAYGSEAMIVSNCVFSDNGNEYAPGGIENQSSWVLIVNCLFSGNKAYMGGAVANYYSHGAVVNCTFYNNSSTDSYYQSHAMYNGGSLFTLANNIFAVHSGSSVFDEFSPSYIVNSLIEDAAYANYSSPGNNANIQADPQFVNASNPIGPDGIWGTADDGLRLQASSPAVNGGSNSYYASEVGNPVGAGLDLSGDPRLYGENVDIGAYEFDPSTPLPVRWISFEGTISETRLATLRWKAEETNVLHYELERSPDGRSFHRAAEVPAAGQGIATYQFTDPRPVNSIAYYRIRQVDRAVDRMDGAFSYSRIISVRAAKGTALKVYPNPVRERVTVELGVEHIGSRIKLVSTAGVVLQEITVKEPVFSIRLDGYPSGVYLLHTSNGETVKVIKE